MSIIVIFLPFINTLPATGEEYVFSFGRKLECIVRLIYFLHILWNAKHFHMFVENEYMGSRDEIWWRHQMKTFAALLAICAENSPVIGDFPTQRSVTRSFDVFFDLRPNERLSEQSWGWCFEMPSSPLWRHGVTHTAQTYEQPHYKYHTKTQFLHFRAFWCIGFLMFRRLDISVLKNYRQVSDIRRIFAGN